MSSDYAQTLKVGDFAKVKGGKRMPAGTALTPHKSKHPYLRIVDFKDGGIDKSNLQYVPDEVFPQIARYVISDCDLYISIVGTIGLVGAVPKELNGANLTENAAKICEIDESKVHGKYLGYFLRSEVGQAEINALTVGSTQPKLALFRIDQIAVPCPPLREQKNIAALLAALDDRITLQRETNATLEAIAQALFKSWFVDFDPVHAKLEGRVPEGIDEATARLFPDSFEESELGLVPRGWQIDSVYTVSTLIYGAPFASKQFNSNHDGKPLIRIRDLRDEAPGVFTPEVHPKGYMVQPEDIVVGMDGEFRAYLWGGEPAWLNQRVCVFAPKAGYPAAFVHRSIMPLLAAVEASETATTVIHLGKNDIDRFKILVPDERVLAAFGKLTDGLYSKIVNSKQSARTLATLRDTLLPRLISGQLRLPDEHQTTMDTL
jgi:type I restriction enzyme S subunit